MVCLGGGWKVGYVPSGFPKRIVRSVPKGGWAQAGRYKECLAETIKDNAYGSTELPVSSGVEGSRQKLAIGGPGQRHKDLRHNLHFCSDGVH